MFKLGLQYTIGNIFKSKYQKGGQKSNWQLDSQAIKPDKHGSNDFQIKFVIQF
jgi:hypothetical protein